MKLEVDKMNHAKIDILHDLIVSSKTRALWKKSIDKKKVLLSSPNSPQRRQDHVAFLSGRDFGLT